MAQAEETFSDRGGTLLDAGGIGAADELAESVHLHRRRKIAALAGILAVLGVIVYLIVRGVGGKAPLPLLAPALPHYVTSFYGVDQPMGVAVSPSGERIYVTESEGPRLVRVYNRSGGQVGVLPAPPGGKNWHVPVYVAVNPRTEEVYVSDRLREDIDVYSASGSYLRAIRPTSGLGRGAEPMGLAFGPEGNLYVTDVGGKEKKQQRVLVFNNSGTQALREFGRSEDFWFPNGIALDSSGDMYVADSDNGRLAILSPGGQLLSEISRGVGEGNLDLPRGVAIDGHNRLYVVDTTAQGVYVYQLPDRATEPPKYIGIFGTEGIGNGQFEYPNGIAIDRTGRIYVTDRENGRVQVWEY